MTAEEALHAVQAALRDHGLPGGVGLRQADRMFLVCLAPADRNAAPAVAGLLRQMGCETTISVNGHGLVLGHLADGLLPAPPREVSSADSCHAAEAGEGGQVKRCADCLQWFPVETYAWWNKPRNKRSPYCSPCNAARMRRVREQAARPALGPIDSGRATLAGKRAPSSLVQRYLVPNARRLKT